VRRGTSSVSLRSTASPKGKPRRIPSLPLWGRWPAGRKRSRRVDSLAALVMAQNAVLERVAGILEAQTVSRTQERAIKAATAKRALELCRREGLKGRWVDDAFGKYWYNPERHMAEAIRKTLRELTGVRAAADIPARMYDAAMNHINTWDYPGAIRRIRREASCEL